MGLPIFNNPYSKFGLLGLSFSGAGFCFYLKWQEIKAVQEVCDRNLKFKYSTNGKVHISSEEGETVMVIEGKRGRKAFFVKSSKDVRSVHPYLKNCLTFCSEKKCYEPLNKARQKVWELKYRKD
ncbi:hypothetical protein [Criblamydia sequanensis]|uniref:Uncharacterized protein n=1 Tax=Candidatus Criblamydia sequanensis CRIB-18 TaxID=1437425 RepID=A0A090CZE1_9BACT|nr:hypothetical protein [Criblamydia sequanensis]CDR34407.1 hypothetical protein CSEC_1593 [Criblamydia sequanensis CRIB-18]